MLPIDGFARWNHADKMRKSSSALARPSSVKTTDFGLLLGLPM
jgi:hypothetical protein